MYFEKYVHTLNIIDSSNLTGHARNGHGLIMKSVYGTVRRFETSSTGDIDSTSKKFATKMSSPSIESPDIVEVTRAIE